MSSHPIYCGVDFAKEKFDYHCAELRGSLPNTPVAHRRFLAMLPRGAHLVCESTGIQSATPTSTSALVHPASACTLPVPNEKWRDSR